MNDVTRRNVTRRTSEGLCRFQVCYTRNLTVCRRFLLPRDIFDGRCLQCEAVYWYREAPVYKYVDKSDCYVHFGDNCGKVLCYCTVNSLFGLCPRCGVQDKWVIIPPENIFFVNFTNRI